MARTASGGRPMYWLIAAALREMAELRMVEGAFPQAAELYRKSLDFNATAEARADLALAELQQGQLDDAISDADMARATEPRNSMADQVLSRALMQKGDYERAGVLEYVVVELDPNRIHWFILRGDHFADLSPGPDGIYRSEAFPGLWLDPVALFSEDRRRLLQVLRRGLATPEHRAFVARLAAARRRVRRGK
jgi:tetratricopeptide (TPR) repeat protein